ncbi:DUF4190 domain-containing protein [Microbacterium sp. 3J1]|uniref:DUF4190 domain-containing protein n=1 Tax=Microbacterium sp. 3J1 TaxID=861269 RepID=UPI000A551BF7|nr:DUF4190 domain-containing protein [Microbacterium sp. 3J1]
MSDNSIPSPTGDQQPMPPAPPAYPGAVPPQPTQAYPGAVPSVAPAPPAYGAPEPRSPYGAVRDQNGAYPIYASAPLYPAARPASGLAITSLVCGIAGVVFGTFLFWLVLPFLASVVAIITGHLALRRTKADPTVGGRGLAFAGLIMGYVMVAIQLIILAIVLFSFLFVGAFSLPFIFSS